MFAHTVSHRTKSIKSRPLTSMTTIPEYYDEYPITTMSRTSSSASTTSSPRSSLMHHDNDSDATIGNDILVLQLAKESKLQNDNPSDSEPDPRPNSIVMLQHPSLAALPPTSLPPPSAYLDIAVQNPWAHETETTYDSSESSSPVSSVSPFSMAIPALPTRNSSRLLRSNTSSATSTITRSRSFSSTLSHRTRSTSGDRESTSDIATTVGGPRTKYSTKLLVQSRRSMVTLA